MNKTEEKVKLLTYSELLEKLSTNSPNHLLLGNGFNNSLGIKTNYKEIFERMKGKDLEYEKVEKYLENESFDIEKLIGHLKEKIQHDEKSFLSNYIERKVKLDFMNAVNDIVQESIKRVYQESNQAIYLLLKNFTNYFTLNYDPFLYLLLLKFKKDQSNESSAVVMQNTFLFQEADLNKTQNNIYSEIQQARKSGKIKIMINNSNSDIGLEKSNKKDFEAIIRLHNKNENKSWKRKDMERVYKQIWWEEQNKPELEVDDGFRGKLQFFQDDIKEQNLYFLHGGFQIVKNKKSIRKITAKQNKSFINKLEEAIHSESENIICIFSNKSEEKKTEIEENQYLKKCFHDLSKINGTLVLLGSSLAENDQHIFEQINKSDVDKIYISSCKENRNEDFKRANDLFRNKEVLLFDYKTISYVEENLS